MTLRVIDLVFVFFSKIYIFFYKEKGDYWKIFPIIIMSTIVMLNIEIVLLQFFLLNNYYTLFLVLPLILFIFIFRKRNYNWVVQYSISLKQKIIIIIIIAIDFTVLGILLNMSRSNYIATH